LPELFELSPHVVTYFIFLCPLLERTAEGHSVVSLTGSSWHSIQFPPENPIPWLTANLVLFLVNRPQVFFFSPYPPSLSVRSHPPFSVVTSVPDSPIPSPYECGYISTNPSLHEAPPGLTLNRRPSKKLRTRRIRLPLTKLVCSSYRTPVVLSSTLVRHVLL